MVSRDEKAIFYDGFFIQFVVFWALFVYENPQLT